MEEIDPEKIRQIPGWNNAPIHICMDADYRGLTFCCKPGHSLTYGFKCKRDLTLKELGLSPEEFIRIKEELIVGRALVRLFPITQIDFLPGEFNY